MKKLLMSFLSLAVVVSMASYAQARPTYGNAHCSDCHSKLSNYEPPQDALDMTSDTLADPGPWNGGESGDRGPLAAFEVAPGGTVILTGNRTGDDPGQNASVAMYRWHKVGSTGSPLQPYVDLTSGSGEGWSQLFDGDGDLVFYQMVGQDRGPFSFPLTIAADTPPGMYDLETYFAGQDEQDPIAGPPAAGGKWSTGQHYYLTVVPEPGSIVLMGLGLIGLAFASRRRRK